jgi:hypothetical protein
MNFGPMTIETIIAITPAARTRITGDPSGDPGGCLGREHQARQGRRERSGWIARARLRTQDRAA